MQGLSGSWQHGEQPAPERLLKRLVYFLFPWPVPRVQFLTRSRLFEQIAYQGSIYVYLEAACNRAAAEFESK